jgi:hypothetical protein
MDNTQETIIQEYTRVLESLGELDRCRPRAWPPVQPVRWGETAIDIGRGAQTASLRREESRLVGRLKQLEDTYHALGGDPGDLHWLAQGRRVPPARAIVNAAAVLGGDDGSGTRERRRYRSTQWRLPT